MRVPCSESARRSSGSNRHTARIRPRYERPRRLGKPEATSMDAALRHWLDTFHFFHTDSPTYTLVAVRIQDERIPDERAGHVASGGRFVYEVARRLDRRGEAWVLIQWEIDVPGILFCECADQAEAMALLAEPSKAAERWHGVRLRPESRPW